MGKSYDTGYTVFPGLESENDVYKHAGLNITKDEIKENAGYTGADEEFKEAVKTYGYGYMAQALLDDKVCEYLCDVVKITD